MRCCSSSRKETRPRGFALLLVLVCLAIASAMLVSIIKSSAAGRRFSGRRASRAQAIWLAESGIERAAGKLAADADYRGETWLVPAEQLAGDHDAAVLIQVGPDPEDPKRRLVSVRADYPNHPLHRARQSKQATVQLTEDEEQ